MNKQEFEALAKRTVTEDQYRAIETLYMASDLDKFDFVKTVKKMLLSIPEEKKTQKIIIGVREMPNGTYMTYEGELLGVNISTGKYEVKRLSDNRCWAEINFDLWHTKVEEIGA